MKSIKNSSKKLFPLRLIKKGECFEWLGEIYMVCDCTNMCKFCNKICVVHLKTGRLTFMRADKNIYPLSSKMIMVKWEYTDCILPNEE